MPSRGPWLAANPGGLRLFAGIDDWPAGQRNLARYVILHPAARALIDDWEDALHSYVAWLRGPAAIEPDAPDLTVLIDELREHSREFAELWDRYGVVGSTQGRRLFHHPDVGDLTLGFQGMTLNGTNGQFLVAFYAEPGTPDHDAMVLLDRVAQERFGKPSASASPA
ncbi:hypothetical protein ACIPSA_39520 [Streptomyces sp. NPDC086549]|uniref:MmyB family transcriptional regulator n=1 Tax=Streptomyces sp. NPDC086549 TaxID=3365752 RepID=UPI00381DBDD5